MEFLEYATQSALDKGYELFTESAVLMYNDLGGGVFSGYVNDNGQKYQVKIVSDDALNSACTCGKATDKHICKHMAALFFAVNKEDLVINPDNEDDFTEEDFGMFQQALEEMISEKAAEVTEYVNSLTIDELREQLIEAYLAEYEEYLIENYDGPEELFDPDDE